MRKEFNDLINNYDCCAPRKGSATAFTHSLTGEIVTLAQFAKEIAISIETPLPGGSLHERVYYGVKKFVAYCTPAPIHHNRRERKLQKICGLE